MKVYISDHAVVRYLERILEIDIEALRKKLEPQLIAAARAGAKMYEAQGATFVFDRLPSGDISVVTVLAPGMRRSAHGRIQHNRETAREQHRRARRRVERERA